MPNIEIYGMETADAGIAEIEINKLLRSKPYANDYVITVVESRVRDRHRVKRPFLRLVSTVNDHIVDIIMELRKLDVDIEFQELALFIPKKD